MVSKVFLLVQNEYIHNQNMKVYSETPEQRPPEKRLNYLQQSRGMERLT